MRPQLWDRVEKKGRTEVRPHAEGISYPSLSVAHRRQISDVHANQYDTNPIDKQADRSWSACLSFLSETASFPGHWSFARGQASRLIEGLLACLFCLKALLPPVQQSSKSSVRIWEEYKYILTYDTYIGNIIGTLLITIGGFNYAK